ncbi:MAG TPA: hypothetical protein VK077_09100 [Virgibacillus sp.]|nr:hypothetical protein [Virgibacillus sp.]
MKQNEYLNSIHRLGRLGSAGALFFMLGIPTFISLYYNIWPNFKDVFMVSSGLLALFVPVAIAEVFSYMPVLGSASYITFITGNVMNLKLPAALNAQELSGAKIGSEESDVITTIAISISSITTIIIIMLGVIFIVPLSPIFSLPVVQTATTYMLPALFGGMFVPMLLNNQVGDYRVKNRLLPAVIPLILIIVINQFFLPLKGMEGFALLLTIPITIGIARIMYKKKIVTMEKIE